MFDINEKVKERYYEDIDSIAMRIEDEFRSKAELYKKGLLPICEFYGSCDYYAAKECWTKIFEVYKLNHISIECGANKEKWLRMKAEYSQWINGEKVDAEIGEPWLINELDKTELSSVEKEDFFSAFSRTMLPIIEWFEPVPGNIETPPTLDCGHRWANASVWAFYFQCVDDSGLKSCKNPVGKEFTLTNNKNVTIRIKITAHNDTDETIYPFSDRKDYWLLRGGYCGIGSIDDILEPVSLKYGNPISWNISLYEMKDGKFYCDFMNYRACDWVNKTFEYIDDDNGHTIEDMDLYYESDRWNDYRVWCKKKSGKVHNAFAKLINETYGVAMFTDAFRDCSCQGKFYQGHCWKIYE